MASLFFGPLVWQRRRSGPRDTRPARRLGTRHGLGAHGPADDRDVPRTWRQVRSGERCPNTPSPSSTSGRTPAGSSSSASRTRATSRSWPTARPPSGWPETLSVLGRLGDEAIDRTVFALRDFLAVAGSRPARSTPSRWRRPRFARRRTATRSSMPSTTGPGSTSRVINRKRSRCVCVPRRGPRSASRGTGLLFDIGGGSLEVTRFADRELRRAWTLPLGALRLLDEFLASDPPTQAERDALARHVRRVYEGRRGRQGGRRRAGRGHRRHRAEPGPHGRAAAFVLIPHLHGYRLPAERLRVVADQLAARRVDRRRSLSGLNEDRAELVVGGATTVLSILDLLGAADVLVSGQGLREGVALTALGMTTFEPSGGPSGAAPNQRAAARDRSGDEIADGHEQATIQHESAGRCQCCSPGSASRCFLIGWRKNSASRVEHARRFLTARGRPPPAVASAVLSKRVDSEAEQKGLAAADVSQRLLIRRAKELIAQPEPATQLLRRLCHGTKPILACEVCMEFGKVPILPK